MVAIPLKKQTNYNELRFALRSLCKVYPDCEVIIIGSLPSWIKGVEYIEYPDANHYEWKSKNIFEKTLKAFELTDRILFMNDDHILLSPVTYSHHKGRLIDNIKARNPIGCYTQTLMNTYERFGDIMDLDTHCPIWYDKEKFEPLKELDWSRMHGYGIKSSYCALNNIEGDFYPDLKFMNRIDRWQLIDRLYFTVDDNCDLSELKNIFPDKCKFES